jgi:hypothetical protein
VPAAAEVPIRWAAEIAPVKEVTLLGSAELAFWQEQLRPAGLTPAVHEGRARIMFCAADGKFKGIAFRELSISIFVSRQADGTSADGAYLVHAFNSSRLFACIERTFFATPYFPAEVVVIVEPPASFVAAPWKKSPLVAVMDPDAAARTPLRSGDEGFWGPIFLPSLRLGAAGADKFFVAKISGATRVFAFDQDHDSVIMDPASGPPVLQWLIDSGFRGQEWHVRAAARHGKSKTYRRAARDPWLT